MNSFGFDRVLLMIVSKYAMADGMSLYSFVFYSNAIAPLIRLLLSLIFHRSPPPLTSITVTIFGFIIIDILFAYTGIAYSSATLATTLLNFIPGFTLFILAILFRMEAIEFGSSTTQFEEMVEVEKPGQLVPESVLKKQKRNEEWALAKKQDVEVLKKNNAANRKLIFNRAKLYTKEYADQQKELIQ